MTVTAFPTPKAQLSCREQLLADLAKEDAIALERAMLTGGAFLNSLDEIAARGFMAERPGVAEAARRLREHTAAQLNAIHSIAERKHATTEIAR